ncbi:MAG: 3-hydroxyacyl-CoA dehydrogenase/enoyl-CoA hydratase family protein [Desulfurococcaceae archaeon]|jgi:enoyl-CoA hydratase/3-hydroxyacyl-CoA dehydrogenase|nr:3-hydroxyacyl-CoA dehydrogenase/enoyl-CoA hydratase family protein [Desulfurococcaceae archaeon]
MVRVEDIRVFTVVGAGTMGHGIAELAAIAGFKVYIADVNMDILRGALDRIRWSLSKLSERGVLREPVDTVISRITPVISVNPDGSWSQDLASVLTQSQFMVEAIPEKLELKQSLFEFADRYAPQDAILATNTSSLPITEIAKPTRRPERVVGMHFFNPPVLMPLVEVIRGASTSDEVVRVTVEVSRRFGKTPVVVNKDVPGFIVNRILGRLMNTACYMVERGLATVEDVDATVFYTLGFPMGVFELADYSGIDVFYLVSTAMAERGVKGIPCRLFEEKYRSGRYGVKSGEGFYKYPEPGKFVKPAHRRELAGKADPALLLSLAVNEAAYLLREGIASKEDIETAVKLGLGWPKGVFEFADELGIDRIVESIRRVKGETGLEFLEPDPLLVKMVGEGKLGRKSGEGFYKYAVIEEAVKETIIVRKEKPIAWIVLNRPERLNAINPKMIEEIGRALDDLEEDPDVRVIVFKGNGRAFCAGADVTAFAGINPLLAMKASRKFQELTLKIQFYTKPTIAAIHGYALGGGLELALSTDFRIASEDAMLGQPEINLGFIPGAGATQRLARIVGPAKAKELIMTGDFIPAVEAHKMGLISKVVKPGALDEEARNLALKLAEKPPLALMAAKIAVDMGLEAGLWSGLAIESQLFGILFSTEDVIEGVTAFIEKRRPKFKGK